MVSESDIKRRLYGLLRQKIERNRQEQTPAAAPPPPPPPAPALDPVEAEYQVALAELEARMIDHRQVIIDHVNSLPPVQGNVNEQQQGLGH